MTVVYRAINLIHSIMSMTRHIWKQEQCWQKCFLNYAVLSMWLLSSCGCGCAHDSAWWNTFDVPGITTVCSINWCWPNFLALQLSPRAAVAQTLPFHLRCYSSPNVACNDSSQTPPCQFGCGVALPATAYSENVLNPTSACDIFNKDSFGLIHFEGARSYLKHHWKAEVAVGQDRIFVSLLSVRLGLWKHLWQFTSAGTSGRRCNQMEIKLAIVGRWVGSLPLVSVNKRHRLTMR